MCAWYWRFGDFFLSLIWYIVYVCVTEGPSADVQTPQEAGVVEASQLKMPACPFPKHFAFLFAFMMLNLLVDIQDE